MDKLNGIGKQGESKMNEMNIHTIADLQRYVWSYGFPKLPIQGVCRIYEHGLEALPGKPMTSIKDHRKSKNLYPSEFQQLTFLCNAWCCGQFVSAVKEVNPLEVFKFRSLSGFISWRSDGPIAWKSIRQNQTALSSCETKTMANNECNTELKSLNSPTNYIIIT